MTIRSEADGVSPVVEHHANRLKCYGVSGTAQGHTEGIFDGCSFRERTFKW